MQIIPQQNNKRDRILRVAAYARVSTLDEEQESSYNSQVKYFAELIKSNKRWVFVEVYADQGKSGVDASKRPNFLRMIEDAKAGKIDLILCKSISRFARNSLEAQEYTYLLKGLDVEVRFEREGLSTFDPQAEMVFNFLTAVAEEESRSNSENGIWTLKHLAEQGVRHIGNNRVLGYDEIDGVLTPNDKAWIPALILTRFAEGKRYEEIADELEEKNAERLRSKRKFNVSQFQSILKNEIYVGDRRIQKQPHVDYKTKKPKWGEEYESFYVEDDHEGIISREVWEKVQERLKREEEARKSGIYRRPNSHFLYGRILCGECGDPMIRRTEKGKDAQNVYWICRDRRKGKKGNGCKNLILLEEELLEVLAEALGVELECTDDANETDFESLKTLRIYEDGKIEIELNEEKETA
jgi:site-specific DNA recombinase